MKTSLTLLAALLVCCRALAQADEYTAKEHTVPGLATVRYRELLPRQLEKNKKYPLVLFLHGAGERGADNKAQLAHGSRMFTNPVNREKYPAIVIFPQCPAGLAWSFDIPNDKRFDAASVAGGARVPDIMPAIKDLIDQYIASGKADAARIYVMGLSMGGGGTYNMVIKYPDLFAAAVPMCGEVMPGQLQVAARKVKFSIYHGDKDDIIPVANSRDAYLALKQYGGSPKYTEFAGCAHNSWDPAFNQPDFLAWLFARKK